MSCTHAHTTTLQQFNAKLTDARVVGATKRVLISWVVPAPVTLTIPRPNWDRGEGCWGGKHFSHNGRGGPRAMWGPELLLVVVDHLRTSSLQMYSRTHSDRISSTLKLYSTQKNDSDILSAFKIRKSSNKGLTIQRGRSEGETIPTSYKMSLEK